MLKSSFKRRYSSSNGDSDQLLGHYLAGLIEGDGSIVVPAFFFRQKKDKQLEIKKVIKKKI